MAAGRSASAGGAIAVCTAVVMLILFKEFYQLVIKHIFLFSIVFVGFASALLKK